MTEWPEKGSAIIAELYRRGRVTFSGLLACVVNVPDGEYQTPNACKLWIDVAPVDSAIPEPLSWPKEPLPEGAFRRTFCFKNYAVSCVHIAAQAIDFEWLTETRLLYKSEAEQPAI